MGSTLAIAMGSTLAIAMGSTLASNMGSNIAKIVILCIMAYMVRPLRIQYEGAHYHIFSKGNKDEYIFRDGHDKGYFIDLLSQGHEKYEVEIFAYCILGNHYHLLIQTRKANLPEFMHYLGSSYGSYLAKDEWKGHVFSGRYKSICVDREEYLMTVSRYIHLNPVAANMAKSPQDYPWSSYVYYLDGAKPPCWLNTEWIVDYFGPDREYAASRYREFVLAGAEKEIVYPSDHIIGQAILGGKEFAERIIARIANESISNEVRKRTGALKELTLDEAYDAVRRLYGLETLRKCDMEKESLQKARRVFVYLGKEHTAATNGDIAEMVGDIKPSTVCTLHRRICARYREDSRYRDSLSEEVLRMLGWIEKNVHDDDEA